MTKKEKGKKMGIAIVKTISVMLAGIVTGMVLSSAIGGVR